MLHRDSTIQKCFRVRRFSVSCQPSGRLSHPVRMTICHCSIRPDDVPYRPDSRQTNHHLSGRRVSPSGPSTVSRRFYPACIRPDVSAARPDASQYSISFRFLSKFQEREDRSTVQTMCYPVWTRISLRQESQIQIPPSGRLTAVVRTRVQQRRKLLIQLQPSGRLPIIVRTRALQIWKLCVVE